ncbi:hypothetical protein TRICI_004591 [Trichomonascus ciferrii]|uniref:ML-like domain-containing protein n=1 Tax=Trichomonascus ciferrii TaxID=44093 RepID=A0A642V0P3_9ASCO|nr:hypothetical protein TRICI_004591 [Trichomonascus ciferrii]
MKVLARLCVVALWLVWAASATKFIKSSALLSCMDNSEFTASKFDVALYPDNKTVTLEVSAISTIEDKIIAQVDVIAYGITVVSEELDACSLNLKQLCPLSSGHFDVQTSKKISDDILGKVPGIAYSVPDIDGLVRVTVYKRDDKSKPLACVQATLSNGKTVQTKWASWGIGIVILLFLLTAGAVSVAGYTSAASHIASNTVSLFVYFQSVAIISMMAVKRLPPIAAAWAQNFQWTMGLMRVGFMQKIFTWYVQATGGTSTNILPNDDVISLEVQKRSVPDASGVLPEYGHSALPSAVRSGINRNLYRAMAFGVRLATRANDDQDTKGTTTTDERDDDLSSKTLVLRGMQRVAYLARIELSNVFLTGLVFFVIIGVLIVIVLSLFRLGVGLWSRARPEQAGRFSDYRRGWRLILKGVLFRLVLVGFPQLSVLCLWELTQRDSAACVVLAVLSYVIVVVILGFAAFKVISIARRSAALHKNPAYILFSDPAALNRWGFLYIQYRATAYYFIVPFLAYTFVKAAFVALAQPSGKTQAMAVFILELGWLVALSWLKPYMDKTTNGFNIAIAAINFINALFFLFFSSIFNQPQSINGIMAVVFFVLNAVFSLVLLIMIIVSCGWAIFSKNPDNRYQPMRDDRESFIRDQNASEKKLTTELDALGATARDGYNPHHQDDGRRDSIESFNNARSNNEVFPQARLPRQQQHLYPPSHNNSSGDLSDSGSPSRADSPGFPMMNQQTSYKGYMPTPTDAAYVNRQPPRF